MFVNAGWESLYPVLDSLAKNISQSYTERSPKASVGIFEALSVLLGNDNNDMVHHVAHIPAQLLDVCGTSSVGGMLLLQQQHVSSLW